VATVPPDSTDHVALFSPDWKDTSRRTAARWAAAARNFDILVGTKEDYPSHLAALRAANPRTLILLYNAGPFLLSDDPEYAPLTANHPDWFARDAGGHLITIRDMPRATLMDQGNAGWRAYHADQVAALTNSLGFDGVNQDNMGWGALRGYATSAPINPTTHAAYTTREWLGMSALTLNAVKAALGTKTVIFNGLIDGPSYGMTKILAGSNADGGVSESFLRTATSPITNYPGVNAWLANLNMELDMAARGKMFFGWTKTWAPATDQQRQDWNRFALATYLLGKGSRTYYNFLPAMGLDRTTIFYPEEQARLGAPLGPYTVAAGVYTRTFAHGTVSVNPAAHTASITVTS
jgi:hypothetical protein